MNHPSLRTAVLATAILAAAAIPSPAGPLDPPAGPITSTYKTLSDVEPRTAINSTNTPGAAGSFYRIAQPGSYYLTEEFAAPANVNGIEIAASDVTIDLMGFTVRGSNTSGLGIFTSGVRNNITVRNGVVSGWNQSGIDLTVGGTGTGSLIEHIHATANGGTGIRSNTNSVIRSCTGAGNSGTNIICGAGGTIESCSAQGSIAGAGISAAFYSTIRACAATGNATTGINASTNCIIADCAARLNGGSGIEGSSGITVSRCTSGDNNLYGIETGAGCSVLNCIARANTLGGVSATFGATITDCTAYNNSGDGIFAQEGATISGCTARSNLGDGIEVGSDCHVHRNQCDTNGLADGAGIHVVFNNNRIDDNNVTQNDRGIDVDSIGNLIIRNSAAENTTNYDIAAGNRYGPIINITAIGTPAALGNAAADTTTTTHPWANFAY